MEQSMIMLRTIAGTLTFVLFSHSLILLLQYINTKKTELLWWASSSFILAIHGIFQLTITDQIFQFYFNCVLVYVGYSLMYIGSTRYGGVKENRRLLLILWLILFLGYVYSAIFIEKGDYLFLRGWMVFGASALLLLSSHVFYRLWRNSATQPLYLFNAVIFLLISLFLLGRGSALWYYGYFLPEQKLPLWVFAGGLGAFLLTSFVWTFSSIALGYQKLNVEIDESRKFHQTLFQNNPDPLVIIQKDDNHIVDVNQGFLDLFGYTKDEVLGNYAAKIIWTNGGENHSCLFGETLPFERKSVLLKRKDGAYFYASIYGKEICFEYKTYMLYQFHETTMQVLTEKALLEQQTQLNTLIENMTLGLSLTDNKGRFIKANPAFSSLLGYTEKELQEMTIADVSFPDELPRNLEIRERLWKGEINQAQLEKPLKRKDGRIVYASLFLTVMRDLNGRPLHFIAQSIDITEKRKLEELKQFLLNHTSSSVEGYIKGLAQVLARVLEIENICATFIPEGSIEKASMLLIDVVNQREVVFPQIQPGSPCEKVLEQTIYICPEELNQQYAQHEVLRQLGAESYAGILIRDSQRRPFMVLSIISKQPIHNPNFVEEVLKLVVTKASSELERLQAEEKLKKAHAKLREEHTRLQAVFANAPVAQFVINKEGVILYAGGKILERIGFPAETVVGCKAAELQPEVPGLIQDVMMAFEGKEIAVKKGYMDHWFEVFLSPLRDERGEVTAVLGLAVDITERENAEKALRRSEARYRLLADNMTDVLWVWNLATQQWEYISPTVEKLRGFTVEEVMQQSMEEVLTPDSYHRVQQVMPQIMQALEQKQFSANPLLLELEQPCKDGTTVWTEASVRIIAGEDGQPLLLGVSRDITERRKLMEKMSDAQKMAYLGTLAAGVTHEINSPLQVITGNTETLIRLLEQDRVDKKEILNRLSRIHHHGWRIAKITRSLLTYIASSAEQHYPDDLNEIIKDTLPLIEHQIQLQASIALQLELADELPAIPCSRNDIMQMIINLVSNARDAMEGNGTVILRTKWDRVQNRIVLEVEDNGEGIAPEIQSRIFDPFFTTKPVGKGMGLGLSIVLGIVKAHKGTIEVHSVPNQGTRFTISFPLSLESLPPDHGVLIADSHR